MGGTRSSRPGATRRGRPETPRDAHEANVPGGRIDVDALGAERARGVGNARPFRADGDGELSCAPTSDSSYTLHARSSSPRIHEATSIISIF